MGERYILARVNMGQSYLTFTPLILEFRTHKKKKGYRTQPKNNKTHNKAIAWNLMNRDKYMNDTPSMIEKVC